MRSNPEISESKTRIILLLILTTLLHMGDFGWVAWVASAWTGMAFIFLIIRIHYWLRYGK